MNIQLLHQIRHKELNILQECFTFKKEDDLLEIGSGSGHQLTLLKKIVRNCKGIDLPSSNYTEISTPDVLMYDGTTIPFANETFDVVFTSNTLEHIPDLDKFEQEILRVVKKGGYALHILPTPNWQIWTVITHPFFLARLIFNKFEILRKSSINDEASKIATKHKLRSLSFTSKLMNLLLPKKHGERGNFFTELYFFSKFAWRKHFIKNGWVIEKVVPSRLFYTGNQNLPNFSIRGRTLISFILGSSTTIYILKKQ